MENHSFIIISDHFSPPNIFCTVPGNNSLSVSNHIWKMYLKEVKRRQCVFTGIKCNLPTIYGLEVSAILKVHTRWQTWCRPPVLTLDRGPDHGFIQWLLHQQGFSQQRTAFIKKVQRGEERERASKRNVVKTSRSHRTEPPPPRLPGWSLTFSFMPRYVILPVVM